MKSKLLAQLAVALPVAAVSAVSFSSSASALTFTNGDALSFFINANVKNLVLDNATDIPPIPSTFVDFTLPNDPPGGNTSAPAGVASNGNFSAMPTGFGSCNDPASSLISTFCSPSFVRDFNVAQPAPGVPDPGVNGLTPANAFLNITNNGGSLVPLSTSQWLFSLDTSTIVNPSNPGQFPISFLPGTSNSGLDCSTLVAPAPGAVGCNLSLDFTATGKVLDTATNQITNVRYFYAVTGLSIAGGNGTGASPYFTTSFSNAGNLRVISVNVPEPGTVTSLLALGAVGSFGLLRRKVKK